MGLTSRPNPKNPLRRRMASVPVPFNHSLDGMASGAARGVLFSVVERPLLDRVAERVEVHVL